MSLKLIVAELLLAGMATLVQIAATPPSEPAAIAVAKEEILALSKDKWAWMAVRKVDALEALFHEEAVFVHMGGTMSRAQELEVI